MNKLKKLSKVSLIVFLNCSVFTIECSLLHHQVKPDKQTIIEEENLPKFNIPYPITIKDESQLNKRYELCGPHYVNVKDMSDCTIELLKYIFNQSNINLSDKGVKQLSLASISATCDRKFSGFKLNVEATFNAGGSIKKQYVGTRTVEGFATTWAIERSIGDIVLKMLEDPDILKYLQDKQ